MPTLNLLDEERTRRGPPTTAPTGTAVPTIPTPTPTPTPAPTPAAAPPTFAPTEPDVHDPRYEPPQTYNTAQLEGFDLAKLTNPVHGSTKYDFARVAQRYAPTPQGFAQLIADPDFKKLGLQSMGNGVVRMPVGTLIDEGILEGRE